MFVGMVLFSRSINKAAVYFFDCIYQKLGPQGESWDVYFHWGNVGNSPRQWHLYARLERSKLSMKDLTMLNSVINYNLCKCRNIASTVHTKVSSRPCITGIVLFPVHRSLPRIVYQREIPGSRTG
jgi:hypothetical protein